MREKAKIEFENSLPIPREKFTQLFDYLDKNLNEFGCDDFLTLTSKFLQKSEIKNIDEIKKWLCEKGGYCDCEVLNNVQEMFEEDAIF